MHSGEESRHAGNSGGGSTNSSNGNGAGGNRKSRDGEKHTGGEVGGVKGERDGGGEKAPRPPPSRLPALSSACRRPPNASDASAEPTAAVQLLQSLLDLLADARIKTTMNAEIEDLCKVRAENAQLSRRLDAQKKELAGKEQAYRRAIASKDLIASQQMREMFDAVRCDLAAERDGAERLRQLQAERTAALREKDGELASVKARSQEELAAQKKAFHAETLRSHREFDSRTKELETELREAVAELKEAKIALAGQKRKLDDKEVLLSAEGVRRQDAENDLARMEEEMGLVDCDPDQFSAFAEALEAKFHQLSKEFIHDLELPSTPEEPLNESLRTRLIRSGFIRRSQGGDFPLLLNNTPWSRCMRMALAENLIATQLTEFIFRPVALEPEWVLAEVNRGITEANRISSYVGAVSEGLLLQNPRNEARWRSLAAKAVEGDRGTGTGTDTLSASIVRTISDHIQHLFGPLLDRARLHELVHELEALLYEAIALWRTAQHSSKKIVAHLAELAELPPRLDNDDLHAEHLDIDVPETELDEDETTGPKPLPLFPRFVIRDGDGDGDGTWDELFEGRTLPPTAPSAIRSRAELRQFRRLQSERQRSIMMTTSSNGGGIVSRGMSRRRPSTSSSAGGGAHTSPTRTHHPRVPGPVASAVAAAGGASFARALAPAFAAADVGPSRGGGAGGGVGLPHGDSLEGDSSGSGSGGGK